MKAKELEALNEREQLDVLNFLALLKRIPKKSWAIFFDRIKEKQSKRILSASLTTEQLEDITKSIRGITIVESEINSLLSE